MRLSLGAAHLLGSGDLKAARTEFAIALSLARRAGYDYLAMQAHTCLGLAALGVGDLVAVREACLAATATAAENGWQASVWSILASAVLGFTELQRAEPVEAGRIAAAALEACGAETSPPLRFALQVVQGAAHTIAGTSWTGWPPCSGRGPSSGTGTRLPPCSPPPRYLRRVPHWNSVTSPRPGRCGAG